MDYFFFYAESNLICIIILMIMLINDKFHSTKQEKQIWFNWTIIAHIGYFISDIGWAALLYGQLPTNRTLVVLFNFSNYIFMNLLSFEWFMYMAASERMAFRKSIRRRNLCRIPMAVSIFAIAAAYIADPYFWISGSGELNIWYYPMMIAVPVCYLMTAFIFSIRNAKKTEDREEKRLFLLIGIYPMAVLAFGLIQVFSLDAPLFCFGCTIMLLFFYIQNLQTQVSVDPLTRLNNRGQVDRYINRVRYQDHIRNAVIMIDIDRFKEINDTWGHAEGDRALVLVSEALKQAAEKTKAMEFIGRYGGDEFTVFVQYTEDCEQPDEIVAEIRTALEEKKKENGLPYELRVSAGWDELRDKDDAMAVCIHRADEKLYEEKKGKGR